MDGSGWVCCLEGQVNSIIASLNLISWLLTGQWLRSAGWVDERDNSGGPKAHVPMCLGEADRPFRQVSHKGWCGKGPAGEEVCAPLLQVWECMPNKNTLGCFPFL